MTDIGIYIKERREELGLTQTELARKVGYKSKTSIQKIENGRVIPYKKVSKFAKALGVSTSDIRSHCVPSLTKYKISLSDNEMELVAKYREMISVSCTSLSNDIDIDSSLSNLTPKQSDEISKIVRAATDFIFLSVIKCLQNE